jgi:hypothetical protein
MAEVVLHGPEIGALVGEVVTATVTQHVGPDAAEFCSLAGNADDVVDGLTGELALALDTNSQGRLSCRVARYRLMALNSSPVTGCLGMYFVSHAEPDSGIRVTARR